MVFSQRKLDVLDKKRANLFNWRGQFTPEFVEYLLESFGEKGQTVLDPFSGSGTVLFEAAKKDMNVHGFEINPAAYAMSKFYTFCNKTIEERNKILKSFEEKFQKKTAKLNGQNLFVQDSSYRVSYSNLIEFCENLSLDLSQKSERIILLNLLFLSEKHKKIKLKESLSKSYAYIKKAMLSLPYSEKVIQSYLEDSRNTYNYLDNEVDLIITSPPYINVFNYHQNYRAIIESFGFEVLKVAHSEFGSNRKNRGNRFKTVVQYCLDMEEAIQSFWKSLKFNGKMILVVGRESNVRKTPFYNGKIVIELIENIKGFEILQIEERAFSNKFGKLIKEDIIIARKSKSKTTFSKNAKEIAKTHLQNALINAEGEIKQDIENALIELDKVKSSPLFNSSTVINQK